jgi:hypothetical protein
MAEWQSLGEGLVPNVGINFQFRFSMDFVLEIEGYLGHSSCIRTCHLILFVR